MPVDNSQSQDIDLDRTDRLPILDGTLFDDDVEDDAVPLEYTAAMPTIKHDFPRPSGVDLPSLAESVRSVEERIARQSADYEALSRSHDKAREAEAASSNRAQALGGELAALQERVRDLDRALAEKAAAAESARTRAEDALRDAERYQSETDVLRGTLAARDTALAGALHSLGERDAQLESLQREHAQLVPALESRVEAGEQLAVDLRAARARIDALAAELEMTRGSVVTLKTKQRMGETEL
ncbi:MAG: hypothetical protein QOD56_2144, partial [Gammaproteobacteria bacterium]|nr:hypothetical protein [Gammaproteobacteria bacterium]